MNSLCTEHININQCAAKENWLSHKSPNKNFTGASPLFIASCNKAILKNGLRESFTYRNSTKHLVHNTHISL